MKVKTVQNIDNVISQAASQYIMMLFTSPHPLCHPSDLGSSLVCLTKAKKTGLQPVYQQYKY